MAATEKCIGGREAAMTLQGVAFQETLSKDAHLHAERDKEGDVAIFRCCSFL